MNDRDPPLTDKGEIERAYEKVVQDDVVAVFYHSRAVNSLRGLDETTLLKGMVVELSRMHKMYYRRYMKLKMSQSFPDDTLTV